MYPVVTKTQNANRASQSCSTQSIILWIMQFLGGKKSFVAQGVLSCLCFELDHNLEQGCPTDLPAMMEMVYICMVQHGSHGPHGGY